MDPEYDLTRLGYPDELRTFTELVEDVERGAGALTVTRFGQPVAVVVSVEAFERYQALRKAAATAMDGGYLTEREA